MRCDALLMSHADFRIRQLLIKIESKKNKNIRKKKMESLDGRTLFLFPFGGANHLNTFIAVYRAKSCLTVEFTFRFGVKNDAYG